MNFYLWVQKFTKIPTFYPSNRGAMMAPFIRPRTPRTFNAMRAPSPPSPPPPPPPGLAVVVVVIVGLK